MAVHEGLCRSVLPANKRVHQTSCLYRTVRMFVEDICTVEWEVLFRVAIGVCDLVNSNLNSMVILFMLECSKIMSLLIKFMSQNNI